MRRGTLKPHRWEQTLSRGRLLGASPSHSNKGGTHDKETKSVNHTVSRRGRHPERGGMETGVRRDGGGGVLGRARWTEGTAPHGS